MLLFPVVFQRGGRGASWLPPAWNSVAYFKPLAQGVSSSSSDFFRTLFVQTLRREGGRRAGGGGAAPGLFCRQQLTCTAVVWDGMAQRGCCLHHPGTERSPNPPGSTEKLEVTGPEHQSQDPACNRQQIPVHGPSCGSREHSQGRQLCCARGLCQAATRTERPTGSQDKIPARPC